MAFDFDAVDFGENKPLTTSGSPLVASSPQGEAQPLQATEASEVGIPTSDTLQVDSGDIAFPQKPQETTPTTHNFDFDSVSFDAPPRKIYQEGDAKTYEVPGGHTPLEEKTLVEQARGTNPNDMIGGEVVPRDDEEDAGIVENIKDAFKYAGGFLQGAKPGYERFGITTGKQYPLLYKKFLEDYETQAADIKAGVEDKSTWFMLKEKAIVGLVEDNLIPELIKAADDKVKKVNDELAAFDLKFENAPESTKLGIEVFQTGSNVGVALGVLAATRSPTLVATIFGAQELTDTYEEARGSKVSQKTASTSAELSGLFTAATEYIGGKVILKFVKGNGFISRFINGFAENAVQENFQFGGKEIILTKTGVRDRSKDEILKDWMHMNVVSNIVGVGQGAAIGIAGFRGSKMTNEEKSAIAKKAGVPLEQLQEMADAISEKAAEDGLTSEGVDLIADKVRESGVSEQAIEALAMEASPISSTKASEAEIQENIKGMIEAAKLKQQPAPDAEVAPDTQVEDGAGVSFFTDKQARAIAQDFTQQEKQREADRAAGKEVVEATPEEKEIADLAKQELESTAQQEKQFTYTPQEAQRLIKDFEAAEKHRAEEADVAEAAGVDPTLLPPPDLKARQRERAQVEIARKELEQRKETAVARARLSPRQRKLLAESTRAVALPPQAQAAILKQQAAADKKLRVGRVAEGIREDLRTEIDEARIAVLRDVEDLRQELGDTKVDPEVLETLEQIDQVLKDRKKLRRPKSFLQFVESKGGLRDQGGEFAHMDVPKNRLRLLNKKGLSFDEAGELAWGEGYFKERPTEAEVLEAIADELQGVPLFSETGSDATNFQILDDALAQLEQFLGSTKGLDFSKQLLKDLRKKVKESEQLTAEFETSKGKVEQIGEAKIAAAEEKLGKNRPQRLADEIDTFTKGLHAGQSLGKKEMAAAQRIATNFIKRSGLDVAERGEFLSAIPQITTARTLATKIDVLADRIAKKKERIEVRNLLGKIKKLLTASKAKKGKGKFTAKEQDTLDAAREAFKKTKKGSKEALRQQAEIAAKEQYEHYSVALEALEVDENSAGLRVDEMLTREKKTEDGAAVSSLTEVQKTEAAVLNMIAQGADAPLAEVRSVYEMLRDISEEGKSKHLAKKIALQNHRDNLKQEGRAAILGKGKKRGRTFEEFADDEGQLLLTLKMNMWHGAGTAWDKWMSAQRSQLKRIFQGAGVSEAFYRSLDVSKAIQEGKGIALKHNKNFEEAFRRVYGLKKDSQYYKKLVEFEDPNNGILVTAQGNVFDDNGNPVSNAPGLFTKSEALDLYMKTLDPTLTKRLTGEISQERFRNGNGNGYSDAQLDQIFSILDKKDLEFADEIFAAYKRFYVPLNEKYAEQNGVNLASNKYYSPVKSEHGQQEEISSFHDDFQRRRETTRGSATKARTSTARTIIKQSAFEAFAKHIDEGAYYIATESKLQDLNALFKDRQIQKLIEANYGKGALHVADQHLQAQFKRGQIESTMRSRLGNTLLGNYMTVALAFKAIQAPKQTLSIFAFKKDIPIHRFVPLFAELTLDALTGGKKFKSGIGATASYQVRKESHRQGHIDQQILTQRGLAMASRITGRFGGAVRASSRLKQKISIAGGKPTAIGDLAGYSGAQMAAWHNQRYLKMSKKDAEMAAIVQAEETQQSKDPSQRSLGQMDKNILIRMAYMFKSSPISYLRIQMDSMRDLQRGNISLYEFGKIQGLFHVFLPSLFQFAANGFTWDEEEQLRAALLGQLNSIPLVGDAFLELYNAMAGIRGFDSDVPLLAHPVTAIKEVMEGVSAGAAGDLDEEHLYKGLLKTIDTFGVPATEIERRILGLSLLVEGDHEEGARIVAGQTPFGAAEATER